MVAVTSPEVMLPVARLRTSLINRPSRPSDRPSVMAAGSRSRTSAVTMRSWTPLQSNSSNRLGMPTQSAA